MKNNYISAVLILLLVTSAIAINKTFLDKVYPAATEITEGYWEARDVDMLRMSISPLGVTYYFRALQDTSGKTAIIDFPIWKHLGERATISYKPTFVSEMDSIWTYTAIHLARLSADDTLSSSHNAYTSLKGIVSHQVATLNDSTIKKSSLVKTGSHTYSVPLIILPTIVDDVVTYFVLDTVSTGGWERLIFRSTQNTTSTRQDTIRLDVMIHLPFSEAYMKTKHYQNEIWK